MDGSGGEGHFEFGGGLCVQTGPLRRKTEGGLAMQTTILRLCFEHALPHDLPTFRRYTAHISGLTLFPTPS